MATRAIDLTGKRFGRLVVLAELWWERVDCGECPVHKECKLTGQECKRLALNWLKKEATDVN